MMKETFDHAGIFGRARVGNGDGRRERDERARLKQGFAGQSLGGRGKCPAGWDGSVDRSEAGGETPKPVA